MGLAPDEWLQEACEFEARYAQNLRAEQGRRRRAGWFLQSSPEFTRLAASQGIRLAGIPGLSMVVSPKLVVSGKGIETYQVAYPGHVFLSLRRIIFKTLCQCCSGHWFTLATQIFTNTA